MARDIGNRVGNALALARERAAHVDVLDYHYIRGHHDDMRAIILVGPAMVGFVSLNLLATTPAFAQMYPPDVPVCLQVFGRAAYTECRYASIAQCQMTASGRSAQCIANPYFVGRPAAGSCRMRKAQRMY